MEETKKSKLGQGLAAEKFSSQTTKSSISVKQEYSYKRISKELKARVPYVDFETEVLPILGEDRKYIFKNYMLAQNGESQKEIGEKLGTTESGISKGIKYTFDFIDKIIENKKAVGEFVEKFGGYDNLEDLALCLSETERGILFNVVLSIDPKAAVKYQEKNPSSGNFYVARNIEKSLNNIVTRKSECEKFIEENGEDFLINEFGMTLSEEYFDVLVHFMMDYHYLSDRDASVAIGCEENYVNFAKKIVLEKLKEYKGRKAEVEEMLNRAGGEERVYKELYSKLTGDQKIIFEEKFLAYIPMAMEEIAEKINKNKNYVNYCSKKIRDSLKELEETAASQKHN